MTAAMLANKVSAWAVVTPLLIFSCFSLLVGDMLFGYDTASFGGILANPGFVHTFGQLDAKGNSHFDSLHQSLLSSLAFIGKFIGCLISGSLIEWLGHKKVFHLLSAISFIGVLIEITAAEGKERVGRYVQFIVGRVIVYISVGLVEVAVTTYQAEIVPASFRGLVVVSLQLFLNAGTICATAVNKAFSTTTNNSGWQAVTGIQFIYPTLIIAFALFIPHSPRWLLSKDRDDEALSALQRLRPASYNAAGQSAKEIQDIKDALQEHVHKEPWVSLIRGPNLRRTLLVIAYYFFQQCTGQAFVSTYQTSFYKQNGYAGQAFIYPVINSCLQFLAVMPAMYLTDKLGRRSTLLISFSFQTFWMFLLAGLGGMHQKSSSAKNMVVASFMLYSFSYNMGGASIPYLLGTELPNSAVREKTQALGTAWNVVWAFVTNFVIPYMIADIHFGVGWVFGGIAALAFVFTWFFLPETKGHTLEDLDAVFLVPFNPLHPGRIPSSETQEHAEQIKY